MLDYREAPTLNDDEVASVLQHVELPTEDARHPTVRRFAEYLSQAWEHYGTRKAQSKFWAGIADSAETHTDKLAEAAAIVVATGGKDAKALQTLAKLTAATPRRLTEEDYTQSPALAEPSFRCENCHGGEYMNDPSDNQEQQETYEVFYRLNNKNVCSGCAYHGEHSSDDYGNRWDHEGLPIYSEEECLSIQEQIDEDQARDEDDRGFSAEGVAWMQERIRVSRLQHNNTTN